MGPCVVYGFNGPAGRAAVRPGPGCSPRPFGGCRFGLRCSPIGDGAHWQWVLRHGAVGLVGGVPMVRATLG